MVQTFYHTHLGADTFLRPHAQNKFDPTPSSKFQALRLSSSDLFLKKFSKFHLWSDEANWLSQDFESHKEALFFYP